MEFLVRSEVSRATSMSRMRLLAAEMFSAWMPRLLMVEFNRF